MSDLGNRGHRQRLRDRFAGGDEGAFTEEALLELLLTYAIPQKDVQAIAQEMLAECGTLDVMLRAPLEKLVQFKGLKENSALLIKIVDWIRQNYAVEQHDQQQPTPCVQAELFNAAAKDDKNQQRAPQKKSRPKKEKPRRGTEMFGKAVLKESVDILPYIPLTDSMQEITEFLNQNLPFNSEQTRARRGRYIKFNLFSDGEVNLPLLKFARAFPASRELKDVCFYQFCRAQPLMATFIKERMLGRTGIAALSRESMETFLRQRYPESKAISDCASAIGEALTGVEIAQKKGKQFTFSLRAIPIKAFAFVLHSEFPEPGMYDLRKVEENQLMQALLWNPDRFLYSIYELRNMGIISKVSEIDTVRQFTTRYNLDELVERLADGEGRS